MRALVLVCLLHAGLALAAGTPTVAVLPFADLSGPEPSAGPDFRRSSGGRGAVGTAIRETVTSDLRAVPGLRVVERGKLDEVLAEQKLQAGADVDVPRAVQVGRLLGATLIVTGAYQRAGGDVRLTARFVKVETGEVVGTAKVDGPSSDFLSLQDRVTGELARSAGFTVAPKKRPRLRSTRVVELYGDALAERDEHKRQALLREALTEEPEFEYALKDLDALEKRLQEIDTRAEATREQAGRAEVDALAAKVKRASDSKARVQALEALFTALREQHRYKRLLAEASAVLERFPLPKNDPLHPRLDERARVEVIITLCIFKREIDRILRESEYVLRTYPRSPYWNDVRAFTDYAMRWKRKAELGAGNAASRLERMSPAERADPCRVARVYHEERQLREAAHAYETCVANPRSDQNSLFNLVNTYIAMPDFASARRALALVRLRYPGVIEQPEHKGWKELPIDAD
jgi:TolB-like protein